MEYLGKILNTDKKGGIDIYYHHIPDDLDWVNNLPEGFWMGCFVSNEKTDEKILFDFANLCLDNNCRAINSVGQNSDGLDYVFDEVRSPYIKDDDHVILTANWGNRFAYGFWYSIYLWTDDEQFDFKSVICFSLDGENIKKECSKIVRLFNNGWHCDSIDNIFENVEKITKDAEKNDNIKKDYGAWIVDFISILENRFSEFYYTDEIDVIDNKTEGSSIEVLWQKDSLKEIIIWNWGEKKYYEIFYLDVNLNLIVYLTKEFAKVRDEKDKVINRYYFSNCNLRFVVNDKNEFEKINDDSNKQLEDKIIGKLKFYLDKIETIRVLQCNKDG